MLPNGPISDRVYLQVGGWQSNIVTLPGPHGDNVRNVVASIDGLFPATGPNVGLYGPTTPNAIGQSVLLTAANFSVDFDIVPGAKPFYVVATSEGGNSTVMVDPVRNTYAAMTAVPSAAGRAGDFSQAPFTVFDFATCTAQQTCFPFPGNVVPASRLDPLQVSVLRLLPLPNTLTTGVNGVFTSAGAISGSHFAISSSKLAGAAAFRGFIQIASAGAAKRGTTFSVYVDGQLAATTDATYTVSADLGAASGYDLSA